MQMLWWFERAGDYLTLEVLLLANGEYELRLISPDGDERVEHFENAADLAVRQEAIRSALLVKGWHRSHEWII